MNLRRATIALTLALTLMAACSDDNTQTPGDTTAPARVADLGITPVDADNITLLWTAPGDDGASGTAASYRLKRSLATINNSNFAAATTVTGVPAPSVAGTAESFNFTVTGLDTTVVHYFALRAVDAAGNVAPVSNNAIWLPSGASQHFVKVIPPFKDNSLFEEGDYSNGAGQYIFTGEDAGGTDPPPDARRALLAFAIADSLPAGAVLDSVMLQLHMSKTPAGAGARTTKLHRLTTDWGEGTSDATFEEGTGADATTNDATWAYRFFNTVTWTTPGGDFAAGASAQNSVDANGFYDWFSAQMTADVQAWLDTPASNFGWIVIGDESVAKTAKRFDSREHPTAANRPKLFVYYTVP